MIETFNASVPPDYGKNNKSTLDRRFLHETQAAIDLVREDKVGWGYQISRASAPHEAGSGDAQMILEPLDEPDDYRESNMICVIEWRPYIVKAKCKARVDSTQMRPNVKLAHQLGWAVMYYLPKGAPNTAKALRRSFCEMVDTLEAVNMPPLEIHYTNTHVEDMLDLHLSDVRPQIHPIPTIQEYFEEPYRGRKISDGSSEDEWREDHNREASAQVRDGSEDGQDSEEVQSPSASEDNEESQEEGGGGRRRR
ncbi:hypothetical protein PG995_008729 [Apiospora arundinis]